MHQPPQIHIRRIDHVHRGRTLNESRTTGTQDRRALHAAGDVYWTAQGLASRYISAREHRGYRWIVD